MPWLEIVITCVALGAMAVGVRRLRGPGGGYWVWAWTALIITAGLILLSPDRPGLRTLAHAAAPLFPLLLLVGAIHFAERRKAKFSAHTLNLAWLVDEMTPLLRPVVAGGAHIEIVRDAEDAWIHADGTQMRQLIMNLITNSSEALGHSGGRIRVRTDVRRVDRAYLEGCYLNDEVSEGRFAVLEVSDDGEGMSPETRERIFDPFFTTKFQGRGLGLASAIGIVRSHGGTIRVESEAGRGTTITILLPCSEPGGLPGEAPQPVPELGGGSVLVVDDEALVRSAARRMLESQGFQVIEAESGAEAIALVRAGSVEIDVLLVDVTMPGIDGEQTLDGIRQILPDLPVVFMSGHSVEEVTARVAGRSNAAHLHKPFRLSDLGKAVRTALDPEGGAPD